MAFPATDWTDRDTNDLGPGQIYTSITATAQYDNVIAAFQKAAGAPVLANEYVVQAMIAASAVGQSQLKTTTASSSVSTTDSSNSSSVTLTGGTYVLGYESELYKQSSTRSAWGSANLDFYKSRSGGGTTSYSPVVSIRVTSDTGDGSSATFRFRWRYIQSSPPYDHGDGAVFGYVYAILNKDGEIEGTYIAEDPPWYGNTPHSPRTIFRGKDGKEYGRFQKPACCLRDVKEGRISLDEFKARWGECETVDEEITTATKLRGMDELPQPFEVRDGQTTVLLDPMDELTGRMIQMMKAGESPEDLFSEGYLRVDNVCLDKRCGPPGVPIHAAKWRNS